MIQPKTKLDAIIIELLNAYMINPLNSGYKYLYDALRIAHANPESVEYVSGDLWYKVGQLNGCSEKVVDTNIRNATKHITYDNVRSFLIDKRIGMKKEARVKDCITAKKLIIILYYQMETMLIVKG